MKTFSYPNNITKGMSESRESKNRVYVRDWIVIQGGAANLVNTTDGQGGFEFFGPFTESEANMVKTYINPGSPDVVVLQLLKLPNFLGDHWNPLRKPNKLQRPELDVLIEDK